MLSEELIDVVISLRQQLETHYKIDLKEGEGPEDAKEMTVQKLVSLVDPRANKLIRGLFGEDYTFHATRAIYAQMAWISYAPPGMSQTSFYSQVLGHKEGSLTTALSYQTFSIRRTLKEDDANLLAKITDLDMELQQVKKTQAKQYERKKNSVLSWKFLFKVRRIS